MDSSHPKPVFRVAFVSVIFLSATALAATSVVDHDSATVQQAQRVTWARKLGVIAVGATLIKTAPAG